MRRFVKLIFAVLVCITINPVVAVEIKYGFKPGNTYEYDLSQSDNSKSAALKLSASRVSPKTSTLFSVKVIDFQDRAFILDIGNKDATYRRYIKENGEIKGAPGETGQVIPFFLTFPAGDWNPGDKHQVSKKMTIGDKTIAVNWNMMLKAVDKEKETAEILFSITMKLPEDRLRKKEFSLKGRAIFNLGEGVIQNAEWASAYRFFYSNKEMAISRNLWNFEKQANSTLTLKGIKEQP